MAKFQPKANRPSCDAKHQNLRSTTRLGRKYHSINGLPGTLVRSKSDAIPLDDDKESSLTPCSDKHRTLRNATRLECSATEVRSVTAPASRNSFSFSGVEIQSHDDLALMKGEDLAHRLPLIRGDVGCLLFMPAGCD